MENLSKFGVNKIFLMGYVGRDPEIREIGTKGTKKIRFTLATEEKVFDEGSWVKKTEWHTVESMIPSTVEFIKNYVQKGRLLHIEGSIRNETFEDKNGEMKTLVKVSPIRIQFLNKSNSRTSDPMDPFSF